MLIKGLCEQKKYSGEFKLGNAKILRSSPFLTIPLFEKFYTVLSKSPKSLTEIDFLD